MTALLATHDPTLMDVADSVLSLSDGTIQEGALARMKRFAVGSRGS